VLFNDAVRIYIIQRQMVGLIHERWIGKDEEGSGCDLFQDTVPGIRLDGQRKTMKNHDQGSRFRAPGSKRASPVCESQILPLEPARSVILVSEKG
jgi:hypothetical protein